MRPNRSAFALSLAPLVAALGCAATIPFDVQRDVPVQAPAGAFETVQAVDLSTEPDLWDRRDDVDGLTVDRIRVEVAGVNVGNAATTAHLTLAFRPDGAPADGSADVAIGEVPALALALGAAAEVEGTPALNAFLEEILRGSGRFGVVVEAGLDGAADLTLSVRIEGAVKVKLMD